MMQWNIAMPLAADKFICILCLLIAVLGLGWAENVPDNSKVTDKIFPTGAGSPTVGNGTESLDDSMYIRSRRFPKRPCLSPQQPANGAWRLRREFCGDGIADCKTPAGTELEATSQLVYSCNPGYVIRGSANVICQAWGTWTPIPICVEVKCPTLNSVARTASCSRSRDTVSCDFPVLPKTRAEISCRPGYKTDTTYSIAPGNILECNEEGKWDPEPFRCIPVCGKVATRQTPFVTGGTVAKIADFPWHATLYTQETTSRGTKKIFRCGGTIIQANLVLTAAHCVYDEPRDATMDPNNLFVLTGNIHRDFDSPKHDYQLVRKAEVKNVYVYCTYYGLRGNYASDIALLELQQPFVLSQILSPVCLDHSGYSERFLEMQPYGKVAGFGRTETEVTSEDLRTVTVPYIPYSECLTSKHASENHEFITLDKFCAGYSNGSGVSDGDSGGGLVFQRNDLWYVMGIVSVGLGVSVEDGERKADQYSYSLYTKVSTYIDWINKVVYNIEKFKGHRPCRTDSQSFDTQIPSESKPLTPISTVQETPGTCRVECSSDGYGIYSAVGHKHHHASLPDGYVAYLDIGFAYKFHNEIVSWVEARKRCMQEGAQLALIDTAKKVQYVKRQKHTRDWGFVGILRMYDNQQWIAISTGLPVTTSIWRDGFPQPDGDCVLIDFAQNDRLGNHPCTHEHNYICEIPIY